MAEVRYGPDFWVEGAMQWPEQEEQDCAVTLQCAENYGRFERCLLIEVYSKYCVYATFDSPKQIDELIAALTKAKEWLR